MTMSLDELFGDVLEWIPSIIQVGLCFGNDCFIPDVKPSNHIIVVPMGTTPKPTNTKTDKKEDIEAAEAKARILKDGSSTTPLVLV